MSEQKKLEDMLEIWAKVFHPDMFDKLNIQINRANEEYREEIKQKNLSTEYLEIEPFLHDYARSKGSHEMMRKMYLDHLINKIKELYK